MKCDNCGVTVDKVFKIDRNTYTHIVRNYKPIDICITCVTAAGYKIKTTKGA